MIFHDAAIGYVSKKNLGRNLPTTQLSTQDQQRPSTLFINPNLKPQIPTPPPTSVESNYSEYIFIVDNVTKQILKIGVTSEDKVIPGVVFVQPFEITVWKNETTKQQSMLGFDALTINQRDEFFSKINHIPKKVLAVDLDFPEPQNVEEPLSIPSVPELKAVEPEIQVTFSEEVSVQTFQPDDQITVTCEDTNDAKEDCNSIEAINDEPWEIPNLYDYAMSINPDSVNTPIPALLAMYQENDIQETNSTEMFMRLLFYAISETSVYKNFKSGTYIFTFRDRRTEELFDQHENVIPITIPGLCGFNFHRETINQMMRLNIGHDMLRYQLTRYYMHGDTFEGIPFVILSAP